MPCTSANTFSGPLVIRYNSSDKGTRPVTPCDASNPTWLSPDMWLVGGVDPATAKVGAANTVVVQVTNVGTQDVANVNVQAWVSDFTMGGIGPASGIASAGGSSPMTGYTSKISSGGSVAISCAPPWTPTASDAALNGGHVCLAANCYSDTDGQSVSAGFLNICCDSHQGQHNIAVVQVPMGQSKRFGFKVILANPDLEREIVAVATVKPVFGPAALGVAERNLLLGQQLVANAVEVPRIDQGPIARSFENAALVRASRTIINARLFLATESPDLLWTPIQISRFRPVDYQLAAEGLGAGREIKGVLGPGQRVATTIDVTLDPRVRLGSVQTFDLFSTRSDGELIGGARLVAIITE